jgi:hypothetical protein
MDESYMLTPYLVINSYAILDKDYKQFIPFLLNYFKLDSPLPLPGHSYMIPDTTLSIFCLEPVLISKPAVLCGLDPTKPRGSDFFRALYAFEPKDDKCKYVLKTEDLHFFIYQLIHISLNYHYPLPLESFITIPVYKKYLSIDLRFRLSGYI